MEENKVLVEEAVENVAETVNENAEVAVEAGKAAIKAAAAMDIWSVILIVLAVMGLLASGGWVVYLIIKIVKKVKAKKAAAIQPKDNDVFVEADDDEVVEEKTE